MDEFTKSYITCALWSSYDDEGNPLDDWATIDDVAGVPGIISECENFQNTYAETLKIYYDGLGFDAGQAGHDFWLTRNGHGTGFWDRYYGTDIALQSACEDLANAASAEGECYAWVGGDGTVYLEQ
jgi:hypothetical protein